MPVVASRRVHKLQKLLQKILKNKKSTLQVVFNNSSFGPDVSVFNGVEETWRFWSLFQNISDFHI